MNYVHDLLAKFYNNAYENIINIASKTNIMNIFNINNIYKNITMKSLLLTFGGLSTSFLCGLYSYHYYLLMQRQNEVKIHNTMIPILGNAIEFGKNPIKFILDISKKYKEIFGVLLAGERIFFINDLDSYNAIFKSDKNKVINYIINFINCIIIIIN